MVTNNTGQIDSRVTATIIDPTKLTGHQYRVSFHNENYTLGADGVWTDITSNKKLGKNLDLTGSSITSTATWSEPKGTFIIHYLVFIESINYDFCDGIKLQLPSNIMIDSIYKPISNSDGSSIPYSFEQATNTLIFSNVDPNLLASGDSTYRTTNGVFTGGEDIMIACHPANLPIITKYTLYDDNWGDNNGYPGGFVDVNGTDTLKTIANQFVTQHQWNVTDLTTGNIVLKNQTIYNDSDIYAQDYYFTNYGTYGPGGSSGSRNGYVGKTADKVFDGVKVDINGTISPPVKIEKIISSVSPNSYFDIEDFTTFGYPNSTANTTLSFYNGGITVGAIDSKSLQQDYELKWTGIVGDTTINGHTVLITKSGGSYATIFGASNYSIVNHPLNPSPGSNSPFLVRIPFEVWNIDKSMQVNLLIYDRNYTSNNDPAKDGFEVWNENDRVYTWVVNTSYYPSVIDPTSQELNASATWNWAFFESVFTTGDDIKIIYNNPIMIGEDTFTFTVPQGVVGISNQTDGTIKDFSLSQNYPNPFNPTTTIEYKVPKSAFVKIKVYDILGREVETLVNEQKPLGSYRVEFNASKFASGVYLYRMQADNFINTKKLLLIK